MALLLSLQVRHPGHAANLKWVAVQRQLGGNAPGLMRMPDSYGRCVCPVHMFTYPKLLGRDRAGLEDCSRSSRTVGAVDDPAVKKTIYAISLVLLLGALIIQSVWGATGSPIH